MHIDAIQTIKPHENQKLPALRPGLIPETRFQWALAQVCQEIMILIYSDALATHRFFFSIGEQETFFKYTFHLNCLDSI